jgi:hypothetical protein
MVAVVAALILVGTLSPTRFLPEDWTFWCLMCGNGGKRDALANLLLFVPLGVAFGIAGMGTGRAWATGSAFSLAIELAQLFIPGRWPAIGDIVFNGLGAGLGCYLVGVSSWLLRPPEGRAPWLSLVAGSVAAAAFLAPALLLSPSFIRSGAADAWSPRVTDSDVYQGRVIEARIGKLQMPLDRFEGSDSVRALLVDGVPLEILAQAGDPPSRLVRVLKVVDNKERVILTIGPDREDLVLEYRSVATSLGLGRVSFRPRDWLRSVRSGDTVELAIQWAGSAFCVTLNERTQCDLGFTVGQGWWTVHDLGQLAGLPNAMVSFWWVVALMALFGFWARRHPASLVGGAVALGAFVLAPIATGPLLPTPWWEWLGLLVGVALGVSLRRGVWLRDTGPGERERSSEGAVRGGGCA